eukprot:TRINITY_DN3492_c0_g2_i1.p1 TRINITY_DN3492_c0_g2~~TRINITY_DN3492_c0_g2_i1.p1  ORF type:complete len:393 (-),score=123.87 TRINITY_DN3492_c0_g2_i1:29-1207(-)
MPIENPEVSTGPEIELEKNSNIAVVQQDEVKFEKSGEQKADGDHADSLVAIGSTALGAPINEDVGDGFGEFSGSHAPADVNEDGFGDFSDAPAPTLTAHMDDGFGDFAAASASQIADDGFGGFSAASVSVQVAEDGFGDFEGGFAEFKQAEVVEVSEEFGSFEAQTESHGEDWGTFNEQSIQTHSAPSAPVSGFGLVLRKLSQGDPSSVSGLFEKNFPKGSIQLGDEPDDHFSAEDDAVPPAIEGDSFLWSKSFLEQSLFKALPVPFPNVTNDLSPFLKEDVPALKHRSSLVAIIEPDKFAEFEDKFEESPERKRSSNMRANALDIDSPGRFSNGRSMSTFSPAKADALELLRNVLEGLAIRSPSSSPVKDTQEDIKIFMKNLPDLSYMLKP